jgi:protein PhnA
MNDLPACAKCGSEYTYEDRNMLVCPECGFECDKASTDDANENELIVKDSNGNLLNNGDTVSVIKDLKLKGSSAVVKVGTRVKNIRLVGGDHNIECKISGIGAIKLKSEFVKKVLFVD